MGKPISMWKLIRAPLVWGWRLPLGFTLPFVLLLLLSLFGMALLLDKCGLSAMTDLVAGWLGLSLPSKGETGGPLGYPLLAIRVFLEGIVSVILMGIVVLAAYNLAAICHRLARRRPSVYVHAPAPPGPGKPSSSKSRTPIERFLKRHGIRKKEDLRIGIILAGGGAKGAYQAGALRALHEFLEENDALGNVRMIAGTSIGSWNAMFWLAGLVKQPEPGALSAHERWWREIRLDRIIEFAPYFPLARNHFLASTPWQESFDLIFREEQVKPRLDRLFPATIADGKGKAAPLHFYFTRSNVVQAHLEFATNNLELPEMRRRVWGGGHRDDTEPIVGRELYEVIGQKEKTDPIERMKIAVFASMDIPPLFPYMKIRTERDEWFEDGGVVDNLPMRFGTEIEKCQLLFVLALNSSFEKSVDRSSIARRLFRVMDIRQGVLERNSIRMARLYNEKARVNQTIKDYERKHGKRLPTHELDRNYVPRYEGQVAVFAISPAPPLSIGTAEFWKPTEAGEAFDLMYAATTYTLADRFLDATDPDRIEMTLVSPGGDTTRNREF